MNSEKHQDNSTHCSWKGPHDDSNHGPDVGGNPVRGSHKEERAGHQFREALPCLVLPLQAILFTENPLQTGPNTSRAAEQGDVLSQRVCRPAVTDDSSFLSFRACRALSESHLLVWKVGVTTGALQAVAGPRAGGYNPAEKVARTVSRGKLRGSPTAPPTNHRVPPEQEQPTREPGGQRLSPLPHQVHRWQQTSGISGLL